MYRMSSALEIFLVMRYINVRFTYLLTYFEVSIYCCGPFALIGRLTAIRKWSMGSCHIGHSGRHGVAAVFERWYL